MRPLFALHWTFANSPWWYEHPWLRNNYCTVYSDIR